MYGIFAKTKTQWRSLATALLAVSATALVLAVAVVASDTSHDVASLDHGLQMAILFDPSTAASDIAPVKEIVSASPGVRSEQVIMPAAPSGGSNELFGSNGPSLLPCYEPGCGPQVVNVVPGLEVDLRTRADLTALRAQLVHAPGVLGIADTQRLVDHEHSRLDRWELWGLTSAGVLVAGAIALARGQRRRTPDPAPVRYA